MLYRIRYQLVVIILSLAWLVWVVPDWSYYSDRSWLGKEFMLRDGAEFWQDGQRVPEGGIRLPFKVTECSYFWVKFNQAWVRKRDVVPFAQAQTYYRSYLKEHPRSGWAHTCLGIVWEHQGDLQHAIDEYTKAIRVRPQSIAPRLNRATLYGMQGKTDLALQDLDAILEIDAENVEGHRLRGSVYENRHDYINAWLDYQAALNIEPDNPYLCNALAWLLATCPDPEIRDGRKAVTLARKACELNDWSFAFPIDTLAAAYAESGDFEQAVKYQELALNQNDDQNEQPGMEQRLGLYQRHQPYHQSKPPAAKAVDAS